MQKHTKIILTVLVTGFLVWFLWFALSPLVIDKVVKDENQLSSNISNSEIPAIYEGSFTDADNFHKVSGTAKIISQGGKKYLRLENFEATNGPDLYVYVSKDKTNDDFVNLGKLKGNIGDQNYELKEDVNFDEYNNVLIWCRTFHVLFGSAEISRSGQA